MKGSEAFQFCANLSGKEEEREREEETKSEREEIVYARGAYSS